MSLGKLGVTFFLYRAFFGYIDDRYFVDFVDLETGLDTSAHVLQVGNIGELVLVLCVRGVVGPDIIQRQNLKIGFIPAKR